MAIKVRVLLSSIVVLATMSLVGCGHYTCGTTFGNATCASSGGGISQGGNGGSTKAFGYFVDFSHLGNTTVGMALQEMDSGAGTFNALSAFVPPTLPAKPTGLLIVDKNLMYIPSSDGTLYGYTIDLTSGALTMAPGSPYFVDGGTSIATNAAGTLLFVGDVAGQRISVFSVSATGSLAAVSGSPFPTLGLSPAVMATDGQNKFLYVSQGSGSSLVGAFSIASAGTLTAVPGSPFSFSMSALAGEPSGKYLLGVTGQVADNHVHVFGINSSSGVITEVAGSPFSSTYAPINLAVHPNGAWVYIFNQGASAGTEQPMEGFTIASATGALTEISGSPFANLTADEGEFDQSGNYLFAQGITLLAGNSDSTVTPYTVNTSTGVLTSTLPSLGFPGIQNAAYGVTDAQ